jgi:hypothetical protein
MHSRVDDVPRSMAVSVENKPNSRETTIGLPQPMPKAGTVPASATLLFYPLGKAGNLIRGILFNFRNPDKA